MAGEHAKLIKAAAAFSAALRNLDVEGTITVQLNFEDGLTLREHAPQLVPEILEGSAGAFYRMEVAGVRFEWPLPPKELSPAARRNLGL